MYTQLKILHDVLTLVRKKLWGRRTGCRSHNLPLMLDRLSTNGSYYFLSTFLPICLKLRLCIGWYGVFSTFRIPMTIQIFLALQYSPLEYVYACTSTCLAQLLFWNPHYLFLNAFIHQVTFILFINIFVIFKARDEIAYLFLLKLPSLHNIENLSTLLPSGYIESCKGKPGFMHHPFKQGIFHFAIANLLIPLYFHHLKFHHCPLSVP